MSASIKPKGLGREEAPLATRNYIAVPPGSSHPADAASEPRQVGERQPAGMDVEAAQLGAAVQLREDLAGV